MKEVQVLIDSKILHNYNFDGLIENLLFLLLLKVLLNLFKYDPMFMKNTRTYCVNTRMNREEMRNTKAWLPDGLKPESFRSVVQYTTSDSSKVADSNPIKSEGRSNVMHSGNYFPVAHIFPLGSRRG